MAPPEGPFVDRIDVDAVNSKQKRSLYKARVKIFPKRVSGTFRKLKWWIMAVTLGIYYITPWLRWDRGPYAPDQAVLIDFVHRRAYFFFIEIWPQELFYIAGLLIMAGAGLFLVTSTIGRAWCGYTCPQTVWVDLFLVVERWIEGDRNARMKLDKGPWTFDKIRKRVVKHVIWLIISVGTGGAWIFYFADAPTLAQNFVQLEAPFIAYSTVGILTATTYIFGGFMREQVCTYMCPWPRIQGAMLDEDSLIVTYDETRSEPRTRHRKQAVAENKRIGDCVDCNQCVAVCPMGIDIRDGQQLECITCALCIDACNNVMDKVGLPRDLISYATLRETEAQKIGEHDKTTWRSFIRPRTMVYFTIWCAIGLTMVYALATRDRIELNVLHDRNPVYVQLSDGGIRNGYTVKLLNMIPEPRSFELKIEGLPGATMVIAGLDLEPADNMLLPVEPDSLRALKVYVSANPNDIETPRDAFRFVLTDPESGEYAEYDATFESPGSE
jgi:cytochrome c oxidase accessory protein FixG